VRAQGAGGRRSVASGRPRLAGRRARCALPHFPVYARAARRCQPCVRGSGGFAGARARRGASGAPGAAAVRARRAARTRPARPDARSTACRDAGSGAARLPRRRRSPRRAAVREHELPWLAARLTRARVLVNVAGATVADYVDVIAGLTGQAVIAAFEINASCPNTTAGGLEFGATPEGLRELVRRCRAAATKPISVKLSPVLPDIVAMARIAQDEGADAVTLVNTIPGMLDRRLANGSGGVSGPAL